MLKTVPPDTAEEIQKNLCRCSQERGGYASHGSNPRDCDLVVMDEASMVDASADAQGLKAVPLRSALILVGDADQLPSVGSGNVLKDLIDCGLVPVVRLTEVVRQAAGSKIIVTDHRIRRGLMPEPAEGLESDFHFIARDEPERIAATLEDLLQSRGSLAVRELNQRLQAS